jgi:cytidylate kinase
MGHGAPVVTIDGPSGSGKGTIARALAVKLGWHRLDSGALYRSIGLAGQRKGIALTDAPALAAMTRELNLSFTADGSGEQVLLEGQDISEAIRSEEAGGAASRKRSCKPTTRSPSTSRQS